MKIYDWAAAPNPKRLRMFLVEKGITNIEIVQVSGENLRLKPEYVAKYPQAMVPMLELDDGRQIGESIAICRYFEELYPNPPLLGRDPYERAIVDMWERRAFDEGMMAAGEVFRNTAEAFKDRGLPGFATAVPQLRLQPGGSSPRSFRCPWRDCARRASKALRRCSARTKPSAQVPRPRSSPR